MRRMSPFTWLPRRERAASVSVSGRYHFVATEASTTAVSVRANVGSPSCCYTRWGRFDSGTRPCDEPPPGPAVDFRSEPVFEFEPPTDRIAEDLGQVDVPDAGHPSLRRGVDLEAHDFHGS